MLTRTTRTELAYNDGKFVDRATPGLFIFGARVVMAPMIITMTDFGTRGPYLGEMRAVLARDAPDIPVVDLITDLPAFTPRPAAYLLAALIANQPQGIVVLGIVDPGVGAASRRPVWVEADGRFLVGPDNGLFHVFAARSGRHRVHEITWRPKRLSQSFHGRDLFAPVAACLATGRVVPSRSLSKRMRWSKRWPSDLAEVIYVDGFGNAVTGMRFCSVSRRAKLLVQGKELGFAQTFASVSTGRAFWYQNSMGLVEIAVNQGSAAEQLGLEIGSPFSVMDRRSSS